MSSSAFAKLSWRLPEPLPQLAAQREDPAASEVPIYRAPTRSDVEQLSEPQLLALINMSKMFRAQAIWMALREQYSCPPFTLSTFAELRDLGYADKPEGQKYHRLTVKGFPAATFAADIMQQRHNIHVPYLLGPTKASVTLMCTCRWGAGLRRGDNTQLKAARAFSAHMKTVEAMDNLKTALAPVFQAE